MSTILSPWQLVADLTVSVVLPPSKTKAPDIRTMKHGWRLQFRRQYLHVAALDRAHGVSSHVFE